MKIKDFPKIYSSILILLTLLIPSYFTFYGAIIIKWYFGLSISTFAWVLISQYRLDPINLLFELFIFIIGIIALIISLNDKKKEKKDSFNKIWLLFGIILVINSIIHSVYYYVECFFRDPNLLIWIPIQPIIQFAIGLYLIKVFYVYKKN